MRQGQLSVIFVTDRVIRDLNRQFLHEDHPTDVLAFDMREAFPVRDKRVLLALVDGEIAVSVPTAIRQAKIFGTSPQDELLLYVIHGILHLMGYDDHAAADIKRMRTREQYWLARV